MHTLVVVTKTTSYIYILRCQVTVHAVQQSVKWMITYAHKKLHLPGTRDRWCKSALGTLLGSSEHCRRYSCSWLATCWSRCWCPQRRQHHLVPAYSCIGCHIPCDYHTTRVAPSDPENQSIIYHFTSLYIPPTSYSASSVIWTPSGKNKINCYYRWLAMNIIKMGFW